METKLDKILLSDNVCDEFLKVYKEPEFNKWINSILPEIEECKKQKQDNPWHIYDCLTHILKSVEAINDQTKGMDYKTRKRLAYCMFLHDIGKPSSYIRRYSKVYGKQVDSFFNHNVKSAKIARRVLGQFNFSDDEIKIITKLIYKHDIFMFIRLTDSGNFHHKVLSRALIEEEISDLDEVGDGEELLSQLIMIGRADNLAQNPKMTQDSLKLLDSMEHLIQQ